MAHFFKKRKRGPEWPIYKKTCLNRFQTCFRSTHSKLQFLSSRPIRRSSTVSSFSGPDFPTSSAELKIRRSPFWESASRSLKPSSFQGKINQFKYELLLLPIPKTGGSIFYWEDIGRYCLLGFEANNARLISVNDIICICNN